MENAGGRVNSGDFIILRDRLYFKLTTRLVFMRGKKFSEEVLERLESIGIAYKVSLLTVGLFLPFDWWAIRKRSVVTIIDHMGRIRAQIGKTVKLLRRFTYALAEDDSLEEGIEGFTGVINDYCDVSIIINFTRDFKLNALLDAAGDRNKLEAIYKHHTLAILEKKYPLWQIETMYWDEPVKKPERMTVK